MLLHYIGIRLVALLMLSGFMHPYYISIYQLTYSEEAHSLQITARIFTDDLEHVLEAQGVEKLNLGTEDENPKSDHYIETYLKQNFSVQINGTPVVYHYLGKETELDGVTWCYLEADDVERPQSMVVTNRALLELHDTQTNMIHIKVGTQKKSLLLRKGNPSGQVEL